MSVQLASRPASAPTSRFPVCHIAYTRDTWVNLFTPPTPYAAAEAQLLC